MKNNNIICKFWKKGCCKYNDDQCKWKHGLENVSMHYTKHIIPKKAPLVVLDKNVKWADILDDEDF